MKNVILASLLVFVGLFSGCWLEDEIEDEIKDGSIVVHYLNGNSVGVSVYLEGDSKYLSSGQYANMHSTDADSTVDVKYVISGQTQGETGLKSGKTHAYVSSDCPQEYFTHATSTSQRIQVINMRGSTIENGDYSLTLDGEEIINVFDNAPNCQISPVDIEHTSGYVVVTRHSDGKQWDATVEDDYSFDVVVLPNDQIKILPLMGLDDFDY